MFNPRPDFKRNDLVCLDGMWDFAFDEKDYYKKQGQICSNFDYKIKVPYVYQSKASGIGSTQKCENVWYRRTFSKDDCPNTDKVFLVFGACDYYTEVFLNGRYLGSHTGGYTPFKFDITPFLEKQNTLVVYVKDEFKRYMPRGKQHLGEVADRCWYVASTGIWQSVWLEGTGKTYIEKFFCVPSIKNRNVAYEMYFGGDIDDTDNLNLSVECQLKGKKLLENTYSVNGSLLKFTLDLEEPDYVDETHYWSPENPVLFDVIFRLKRGNQVIDKVSSYFGFREIEIRNGEIVFNNRVIYQRLVLHQGYYDKTMLTPPSDQAIIDDLMAIKELGYNGVRMHQKIEDPRFYYYADKLGLYVWGELPSGYGFCVEEINALTRDMKAFVERDFNHPSIICWVPLNESWGVRNIRYDKRQINFAKALYHLTKSMDHTRLVSANDGWEIAGGDIIAVHSYAQGRDFDKLSCFELYENSSVDWRLCLADGEKVDGRPIILSEFGGLAFSSDSGWGYGQASADADELLKKLEILMRKIYSNKLLKGFCYTQLTDVFQETNGHMTMDRKMKIDKDKIRKLIEGAF